RGRASLLVAWARVRGRRGRVPSARHDGNATERRADEGGDEQESIGAVHRGSPFVGKRWSPSQAAGVPLRNARKSSRISAYVPRCAKKNRRSRRWSGTPAANRSPREASRRAGGGDLDHQGLRVSREKDRHARARGWSKGRTT